MCRCCVAGCDLHRAGLSTKAVGGPARPLRPTPTALPFMLRLLVETSRFRCAVGGPVFVVVWHEAIDSAGWAELEPHLKSVLERSKGLYGLLVVAQAGIDLGDLPHSRMVEFMKYARGRVVAAAFVFRSAGLSSALGRAAINAVMSLAGNLAGPLRFFSETDEAAGWLEDHLRLAGLLDHSSTLRAEV